ncbi:MAG TPA: hypothetical protein VGL58_03410 [Caulobacteraceae bacterium]|jgi:hypothetical protein
MNSPLAEYVRRRSGPLALFSATAAAFLVYALQFKSSPYLSGDGQQYWDLGSTFFQSGHFNLLDFGPNLRGYFLPLTLGVIQGIARALGMDAFQLFFFVSCVFTAAITTTVVPTLMQRLFGIKTTTWQSIFFSGLFFLFWRGYLVEPLSDSWSVFLLLISMLCVSGLAQNDKSVRGLASSGLAGVCGGIAANVRPIYIVCLPVLLVVILLAARKNPRVAAFTALAFCAGAWLAVLPQSVINYHYLKSWNPLAQSGSLYFYQAFFGLPIQRNECAFYVDSTGLNLANSLGIKMMVAKDNGEFLFNIILPQNPLRAYLSLAFHNPIEMSIVYLRHIVNGITLINSNIYQCAPGSPRRVLNVLSSGSIMLALFLTMIKPPKFIRRRLAILVLVLAAPVILVIPTAVEGRFFLPLHLAAYAVLAFGSSWMALSAATLKRAALLAPLIVAMELFTLTIMADTYQSTYLWLGASTDGVSLRQNPVAF